MRKIKSKTIFSLVIFFFVILILFFSFYKILSHGIRVDYFHVGKFSISKLYLKLDNKFILKIDELNLEKMLSKSNSSPLDIEDITKKLHYFTLGIAYFQDISIKTIKLDKNNQASISYNGSQYKLSFPNIDALFDIQEDAGKLKLEIKNLRLTRFDLNIKGKLAYSPSKNELFFNIATQKEKNNFFIQGNTNFKKIQVNLKSNPISSLGFLKPFLADVNNQALKEWLFEKIFFDQAVIENLSFRTTLSKSSFLHGLISTLKGKVLIHSAEVSLFNDIDPIRAKTIQAIFGDKKITLRPENIIYGQTPLEGSVISFENLIDNPKINIHIKSDKFKYSNNLIDLLKRYSLDVPIQNIDAPLEANLNLIIGFLPDHKHEVTFNGGIKTKNANITLYNIPIYAKMTHISFDITPEYKFIYIKTNDTYYYNMLQADLDGVIDLKKEIYKTHLTINHMQINTNQSINFQKPFLVSSVNQTPKQDQENNTSSIPIEPDQKSQETQTPQELLKQTIQDKINHDSTASLESDEKFSNQKDIDEKNIQKLKNDDIDSQVEDSILNTNAIKSPESQDSQISIESQNSSQIPTTDQNTSSKDQKKSRFDDTFNLNPNQLAPIELKKLIIASIKEDEIPYTQEIINIAKEDEITLDIEVDFKNHEQININIPDFKASLTIQPDSYIFRVDDFSQFFPYSPLLKYLDIRGGNAYITTQDFKDYTLLFSINQNNESELPFYNADSTSNERIKSLDFSGTIRDGDIQLATLDKKITFSRKNSQNKITIKGYNFNLDEFFESKIPAIQQALHGDKSGISPTKEQVKNRLEFLKHKHIYQRQHQIQAEMTNIEVKDMSIHYKGYTIPTDDINIRFRDQRILADATYKNGIANLDFIDGDIYIKATNFSANFINLVTQKNLFDGGLFTLFGAYKNNAFNGELKIQNTLFRNFAVLQNVINLIDTVPSLIVFKNPNLGTRGYQVSKGNITFGINKEYIGLEKIHLIGESMDVDGNGIIQLNNKEINANLKISTIKNLSSILSKIPIIGYLTLGDEGKISTNVAISGTIENPKTNVSLAEDVITAPFHILRRIFKPIDVIMEEIKEETKNEDYRK